MNIKDGGPAFPVSTLENENGEFGHQSGPATWQFPGITLRDYFAAKVIGSIIEKCAGDTRQENESRKDYFARISYDVADAMIAAREAKS